LTKPLATFLRRNSIGSVGVIGSADAAMRNMFNAMALIAPTPAYNLTVACSTNNAMDSKELSTFIDCASRNELKHFVVFLKDTEAAAVLPEMHKHVSSMNNLTSLVFLLGVIMLSFKPPLAEVSPPMFSTTLLLLKSTLETCN